MTAAQLIALLTAFPDTLDITVKGRGNNALLSLSIPENTALPSGWHPVNEASFQQIPGWKRVKYQPK